MELLLHFTSCDGRWVLGPCWRCWAAAGCIPEGCGYWNSCGGTRGVAAVSAPAAGGLVELEAHSLGEARFSVKVSRRTDIFSVITTQANIAVRLSQACKSHCPLLKVYLIPAQGQIIGRTATELLVVR